MVTQEEIEWYRREARLKKQRDDAWLPKAFREEGRAEGSLMGRIQFAQKILRREVTPEEVLETRSIKELQALADQLENEVMASRDRGSPKLAAGELIL